MASDAKKCHVSKCIHVMVPSLPRSSNSVCNKHIPALNVWLGAKLAKFGPLGVTEIVKSGRKSYFSQLTEKNCTPSLIYTVTIKHRVQFYGTKSSQLHFLQFYVMSNISANATGSRPKMMCSRVRKNCI